MKKPATVKLGAVESYTELARVLKDYFGDSITIDISPQRLSAWKSGIGVPDDAPPFPAKKGRNRLDVDAWAKWIEQVILPTHQPGEEMPEDIFIAAKRAKAQKEIDEGAVVAIQRLVHEETYMPVQNHLNQLRNIGAALNRNIGTFMERGLIDKIMDVPKELPDLERRAQIVALCQSASDMLRGALEVAVREACQTK